MRTPGHDFELAAGWVVHEGLVAPASLTSVAYCTDVDLAPEQEFNVVTVTASGPVDLAHRHAGLSSGSSACGVCGKDSIDAVLTTVRGPRWEGPRPRPEVVRRLPGLLREGQDVFGRTGGVHAAGLFSADGDLHVVREDVGRHNAVDKVTGARVLAGESPGAAYLVVSGRAGFELVQKAVAAGRRDPGGGGRADVARGAPGPRGRARPLRVHPRRAHRPLRLIAESARDDSA